LAIVLQVDKSDIHKQEGAGGALTINQSIQAEGKMRTSCEEEAYRTKRETERKTKGGRGFDQDVPRVNREGLVVGIALGGGESLDLASEHKAIKNTQGRATAVPSPA